MNKIKRIMACLMATASLATGMVGMSASATNVTEEIDEITKSTVITIPLNQDGDTYSTFNWGRSGNTVAVRLTAKSGTRYGQVSVYGYDSRGYYVSHIVNEGALNATSNNVDDRRVEKQGTLSAYSYTYYGYLYLTAQPMGKPLSYWEK